VTCTYHRGSRIPCYSAGRGGADLRSPAPVRRDYALRSAWTRPRRAWPLDRRHDCSDSPHSLVGVLDRQRRQGVQIGSLMLGRRAGTHNNGLSRRTGCGRPPTINRASVTRLETPATTALIAALPGDRNRKQALGAGRSDPKRRPGAATLIALTSRGRSPGADPLDGRVATAIGSAPSRRR